MATLNFQVAWIAILAGLLTGAAIGMFFHAEEWLGGYGSWRRRMLRQRNVRANRASVCSTSRLPHGLAARTSDDVSPDR